MGKSVLCICRLILDIQFDFSMNISASQSPEQPEILLQLRQKTQELKQYQTNLKQNNKQLSHSLAQHSDELNILLREKEIQERKSKSLVLLVTDIQRQVDNAFMESHDQNNNDLQMEGEERMLREMLVKIAEKVKEDQKLMSFLRQATVSGSKSVEFIQRSKYLESQTELLAKLRSQISSLSNPNLQCTRKWSELHRQSTRLQKQQSFLKIQSERLKTELREHYEQYLQHLNRSKASIVNFNETQRQKVITEHLVQEVAVLQERRLMTQEQGRNLKYHQQTLLEENARIQSENRELKSFFVGNNQDEEVRLATKMKARIEELRDSLAQIDKLRTIPQLPFNNLAEAVRSKLRNLEESQDFIQKKIKEEQNGKIVLDEKNIIAFFEDVLRSRDEKLQIIKQKQFGLNQKMKEILIKKQLLQNQIANLDDGLRYHHYQNNSAKLNTSSIPYKTSGTQLQGVSKWRDRKAEINVVTTTSKFITS